jgi:hypothetical protein
MLNYRALTLARRTDLVIHCKASIHISGMSVLSVLQYYHYLQHHLTKAATKQLSSQAMHNKPMSPQT